MWSQFLYFGAAGNCHVLALSKAFVRVKSVRDLLLLDALSSVPFGVRCVREDPNRLMTGYLNPVVGLDRLTEILALQGESLYFDLGSQDAALNTLDDWLTSGPVMLGPLDMGGLPYLYGHAYLAGNDHYVIAVGRDAAGYRVDDPEGVLGASIARGQLLQAWRGDIPEAPGAFHMRRFDPYNFDGVPAETLCHALALGRENLAAVDARAVFAEIFFALAEATPTQRRAMSYLAPARAQRIQALMVMFEELETAARIPCTGIQGLLHQQMTEIAALSGVMLFDNDADTVRGTLTRLGDLEDNLADAVKCLLHGR